MIDPQEKISIKILWNYNVTPHIFSSPIAGDIDNDGEMEIVVGSNYSVYAINANNGSLLWRIKVPMQGIYAWLSAWTSPVLGDIDNDNDLEVVIGNKDGLIYALNGEDGWPEWVYICNETVYVSPVICDLDKDEHFEVLFCAGSFIYCLSGENGSLLWFLNVTYDVLAPPSVGDLNNDGVIDIVIQCGDKFVYAIDGYTHNFLWQFKKDIGREYFPGGNNLLVDVNRDGILDVIVSGYPSVTYAINGMNGSIIWVAKVPGYYYTPGDLDGDGLIEIIASLGSLLIINAEDGTISPLYPYSVGSPLLCDIDGDNKLDIIAVSHDGELCIILGNGELISESFGIEFPSLPILVDVDSDLSPEIVACSIYGEILAIDIIAKKIGKRVYWCCERGDTYGSSNVLLIDADYDMLSTYSETLYGLNASNPDTDGDNLPDGWEIYHELDPKNDDALLDLDNDDLTNLEEYKLHTDPRNNDTDNDGLLDGEEIGIGTDPLNSDSDGDLVDDGEEIKRRMNPLSRDTDKDGLIDYYDPLPTYPIEIPLIVATCIMAMLLIIRVIIKRRFREIIANRSS